MCIFVRDKKIIKNIYLNVKTFTIPVFWILYCCIADYMLVHLKPNRC